MRAAFALRTPRRAARGFTLLEMLVVMVIIGLLAGLVGPRIFGKVDTSKVQTAQTQIKMLESALNIMRLDVGQVPPPEQGLQWLTHAPTNPSLASLWQGPYIEGTIPMDPWNNPYQYKTPGVNNKPYSVFSFGADGKEGGAGLDADIGLN
ncbi:MAG: type II secretion system major pseudopilin GspG [Sulfurimicrobium sp.]|nr:type II secretion system major pseudopilin GspG [Sulfurimicrobium sp.]